MMITNNSSNTQEKDIVHYYKGINERLIELLKANEKLFGIIKLQAEIQNLMPQNMSRNK
jgi:hypothetical protein